MIVRQHPHPGPISARSSLRLPSRLTLARSGKLANQWTLPRQRCAHRSHVHRHRTCCKRSDSAEDPGLLNLRVQILIKEGDSLESLSAKYDIPEAKLRSANGGQSEVSPGTELVIIQKVPSDLMPTPQNKLVPIEAAYSDDEAEVALVKENKQILDEQAQLAQFYGVQTPGEIRRDLIGTARYLGGILVIVGLGVYGVWGLWNFVQKARLSNIRSRLEDPDIRAEMARRHGQSFLDHLDSENAEAEAEEIYDAKNSARRAAERHLRRQHAALKLQQSPKATGAATGAATDAATGAAAGKSRSLESEHAHQQQDPQQQQEQQQQQESVPALFRQQQQQEPVQALDQPSSQQKPRHSPCLTPSASQAAPGKSQANPYTTAAGSKSRISNSSDNLSHVLHTPSSSAVSAANGLSAAGSTEVDKAASSTEADKAVGQSHNSPSSSSPPSMHHESTASHHSNGATMSGSITAPKPSISDSEPESSVPAAASAASTSDSMAESPSDTASMSVDQEAAEATTSEDKAVHADESAADDPAADHAADVADDPVAQQCPWVHSELLYYVTDDEGNPLNTILPAVGEAGVEQQQCFLAYEAHADMLAMMYKTAALLPEGLVPTGLHPLMLLDACMGEGRPLAIVREGAAGGTEQVTDAQEWLQQLAASAQILFADEMKYILMSRLDKIEELEAEFAAEGASHDVAEAESDGEADTEAVTEPAAAARVHEDPAPSMNRVDPLKSHASDESAGASTRGQQGATPSGEREDAYAAMKKKQVVHLSKDVLNQLSQTSTHAQASTIAPQPQSSAVGSATQNGNGRHAAPSNNGKAWQSLSHVCVPLIKNLQGDLGYVTADMAEGDVTEQHILAFQARSDAELVRCLVQAHLNELEAKVSVVLMTSEQLQTRASDMECQVTVYPPGQLRLKPGMTFEQLRQAAVAGR